MNNRFRHFLIRSNLLLSFLYLVKRIAYRKLFFKEIEQRKTLDLFDIDKLSKTLSIYPIDYCPDNELYGISATLKQYCDLKIDRPIPYCIEHGVYFGDYVSNDEKYYPEKLGMITFSNYRKKMLIKSNCRRKILEIGSYINYAHSLLSIEEIKIIKEQYGKILLVFPSHSVDGVNCTVNFEQFVKEICKIGASFDSVWVCVYFVDLTKKDYIEVYKEKGFEVVTCGHKYDLNFLNRQRTLIELSEMTMSNGVGTHVGYSIVLNKSHYIYEQKKEITFVSNAIKKHQRDNIIQMNSSSYVNAITEICKTFSIPSFVITEQQKKIIEKYWGRLQPYSPEELRNILF